MPYDWEDFDGESGTEDVPLLLSNRSQLLILSAMQSLERRSNWFEVDDATWDDISAAIGEAYEEIIEEGAAVATPATRKASMWRTSNQTGIVSGSWLTVLPTDYNDPDGALTLNVGTGLFTLDEGNWLVSVNVNLVNVGAANAQFAMRLFDFTNATSRVSSLNENLNTPSESKTAINMLNEVIHIDADTEYGFQVRCNASSGSILARATVGGELSYSFKATFLL